jgi:hypothetical protein
VLRLVGATLSPDGYLAGGAAIHFEPSSARFSKALDLFHDTVQGVATSFASGAAALEAAGYTVAPVPENSGNHLGSREKGGSGGRRRGE